MSTYQEYLKELPIGIIVVRVLGFDSQPKDALLLEVHDDWAEVSFDLDSNPYRPPKETVSVSLSRITVKTIVRDE